MKNIRARMILLFCAVLIIALASGCTAAKKPVPPQPGPNPQVNPEQTRTPAEARDTAADVTKAAESVAGVGKAYTVIIGNTALIGFDMAANKQEQGIREVKNSIVRKVEADSRIVRAYVSGDPDITTRIKEISNNVRNGRPVTEYLDEIGEIIQRMTPETAK